MAKLKSVSIRPHLLLQYICALGGDASERRNPKVKKLAALLKKNLDHPLTLQCNVGEVFTYQAPGPADDMPGSAEFNLRCDMEILHKLNFPPGITLPARIILCRVWDQIESAEGICSYGAPTSPEWRGWPPAKLAAYRKGHALGLEALIPPRSRREMDAEKKKSMAVINKAGVVDSRPHILMCALCQYGAGARPPFKEDNVPELLQLALERDDVKIRMMPYADWMMCAPCPYRVPSSNSCVNNRGNGGLPNQMRDLRVLQKLGLTYGSVLPAREVFRRIITRIPGTKDMCRIDHERPSVWYTGCGALVKDNPAYIKGRKALMKLFKLDAAKTAAARQGRDKKRL